MEYLSSPTLRTYGMELATPVMAAYSRSLDRIVVLCQAPDRLVLVNPANGQLSSVTLPHTPYSLGLSLDGLDAAIGYDGYVGVVNLGGASPVVASTWSIPFTSGYNQNQGRITSIAYDKARGYLYAIDSADYSIKLRQIAVSDGSHVYKTASSLYAVLGLYCTLPAQVFTIMMVPPTWSAPT
ncbi:MAG: hypothetical protein A2004_01085 [Spirochaetes bacterium GWC1_61_12]|nr:MAG: hypothetical protein A2004_01085 [Spirochaetes bacterium GWC1_61_12]HAW86066.1 hypothetical protein [Spirochaetaceae bacterium]